MEHGKWVGIASDLLRTSGSKGARWSKNPNAIAEQLRRAQTFLRVLGIEICFSREGRAGTRTIRMVLLSSRGLRLRHAQET